MCIRTCRTIEYSFSRGYLKTTARARKRSTWKNFHRSNNEGFRENTGIIFNVWICQQHLGNMIWKRTSNAVHMTCKSIWSTSWFFLGCPPLHLLSQTSQCSSLCGSQFSRTCFGFSSLFVTHHLAVRKQLLQKYSKGELLGHQKSYLLQIALVFDELL